jgi:general L-amino acid transport system permease protein
MAVDQAQTVSALSRPPVISTGIVGWIHARLFSNWWNALLTLISLAVIVIVVPRIVQWAFVDAIWQAPDSEICKTANGACWAMIREKYRLILLGRYPFDEQWRPLLGMIVLVSMVMASCVRRFWRPWLALVWIGGSALYMFLMYGGIAGLSFVPTNLWGGLPLTLLLSVFGLFFAFPFAILLALGRRSEMPAIKAVSVAYIELIRGVPLVSLLFMASFMLPLFLPTGVNFNAVLRAQVAIIMFTAAYLAENIRGGLQAIPKGQYEAAQAMGLSYWQSMWKIILPQALRIVIPPIVNTFISMFKDTSLVAIVALSDLLLSMKQAIADPVWRPVFVEGYVFIAAIYFVFCFSMSKYSQWLERQLYTGHRR